MAMATFQYRAASMNGAIREGAIEAASLAQAIAQLQGQGLRPIRTIEVATGVKAGRKRKVDPDQTVKAISEMGVLVAAGLSLDRSLVIVTDNIEDAALKAAFGDVHRMVKEGKPLSEAVQSFGDAFPAMAAPMIAAGEANGDPGAALAKLAATLERMQKLRREVTSALIYPAILVALATSVILLMLLFVVPQFEGLFAGAEDRLPTMTQLVVGASRGFRAYGLVLLLIAVGAIALIRLWLARPAMRESVDRALLATPLLGDLVRRMEIGRFARVLGNLLGGGVPLPTALALAQRTVANRIIHAAIGQIVERVREGGLLSQMVAQSGQFPRMALSFVRTGEETARLDTMLDRLADVLDDEVALRLKRLTAMLTPIITIVMGVTVAVIIGSIMTAILGFNELALE